MQLITPRRMVALMLGLCTAALLWAAPAGAAKQVLTLEGALEFALKNNPNLESARQGIAQSQAQVTQAKAPWWPQLTGSAKYSRNYIDSHRGAALAGSRDEHYNGYDTSLSVTQRIYDFGKTTGVIDQAKEQLNSSIQDLGNTLAQVVQQTKNGYFEVLKNQQLVVVAQQTLASQQKHLDQSQAFYKGGLRPKIDVTRGEVSVANAKLSLITAQYNERNSRVALERTLGGRPFKGAYALSKDFEIPPLPQQLDPLLAEADQRRPDLASLRALIKAAQGQLRSFMGDYWPTFAANGSYGYENTEFPLRNDWQAGVGLNWAIFSGFLTQGQTNQTRALILQLKAQLRDLNLQVNEDVTQAFLNVHQAFESVGTSKVALANAEENMRQAEGRYSAGVGDIIEYTDAQLSLTQAQNNLVQARYGYLQSYAQLDRAVGRDPWATNPETKPAAK